MSSPSVAIEQTLTWSNSAAEQHVSSNNYYSIIVIENATTTSGQIAYVAVDGGTATAGANHEVAVPPGKTVTLSNLQALPNANSTPDKDESESVDWSAQQGWAGTNLTYVSVIPASLFSGVVTISLQ